MDSTLKNIFLILFIIDMILCAIYWLFEIIQKQINKNAVSTSKAVKVIDKIKDVAGKLAVVLFELALVLILIYTGYICLWVESPLSNM